MTKLIRLNAASAQYDITVGKNLLGTLHQRLQKVMAGKTYRPFLVTSPNIWKLWSDKVRASFPEAQSPVVLFHPAGEKFKRFAAVEALAEQLAEHGADRDALLLAFGGGVIGDITGFLAAIYMRGVPYVQIPTTLLAQVDSSVGGKTGVNLAAGKNLVGSFHHPRAVFVDIDLLSTLPSREMRAGLQESVKAGIIRSPKLFSYLEKHQESAVSGDPVTLIRIISASIKIKAEIVQQDEKEADLRMILNFGHTLGHAIEAATGYRKLLHGEAIAWGSIAALHLGLARNLLTKNEFDRIMKVIISYGPLPGFTSKPEALVALTASDKKTRSGRRAYILPRKVGKVEVVYDVTDDELAEAARTMMITMKQSLK